jgi:outer membrane putative beta-barrel porin/alpha-amylase
MLRRFATAVAACLGILSADSASAQTLVDQMRDLFLRSIVLSTTPGGGGIVAHTPVFVNDPRVVEATSLIDQISQQIGSQVSLFPLGSSSGGFTFAYDSALGTFNRTTQTFGPAFAERAAGLGKGKYSFGMNYIHAQYKALDGFDLKDGSIKINLRHQALTPPSFVEGDIIQAALKMDLRSDAAVFLFNAGVTDRLDVGVGIPIIHVAMDLTYHATILDFATHTVSPTTHVFSDGSKTRDFSSSGSASGIGDVIVRSKYNLMTTPNGGVGAGLEIKLPTGDEESMLGTGAAQARLFFIGSGGRGKSLAHVNFGYTASGEGASDQVNYVGGVEYAATPKVTVVADILGWNLRDAIRLRSASTPVSFQQGPAAPFEQTTAETVALSTGSVNTALGTAGVKLNPWGNLLISAHVLFPLTSSSGLKSGVSPVLGFEYSF